MVGVQGVTQQRQGQGQGTRGPELLPARVKLEVEKNRTIVFLNSQVQELTKKLALSNEDLFRYERENLDLKHEQRELSHRLPVRYAHVKRKATHYLEELNLVRKNLSLLIPAFRFWAQHAQRKRAHRHLVSVVRSRSGQAELRRSLAAWSGVAGRSAKVRGWRGGRTRAKAFEAWADQVARGRAMEDKVARFRQNQAPFFRRLRAGRVLQSWRDHAAAKRSLRARLSRAQGKRARSVVAGSLGFWRDHCRGRLCREQKWRRHLRRSLRFRALEGWSREVAIAKASRGLERRADTFRTRRLVAAAVWAWAQTAATSATLRRKVARFREGSSLRSGRAAMAAWSSEAATSSARRTLVSVARARAGLRLAKAALRAWRRRADLEGRVRAHLASREARRAARALRLWRGEAERHRCSKTVAVERSKLGVWRSKHRAFSRWRVRVLSGTREALVRRLETFEEGLAEVVVPRALSPIKSARRAARVEREARAEADLAAAVSAADTHQWHRFSKGYLIPRAGHSAVFVGDSGPSQATGKYLIFGGHDLQTRQNVFTIVTVSVGIGDSGELRFQTDVIFESDTSVDGPSPRSDHCMCENGEGSVLVFGGFDGTRELGDVHEIRWSAGAMPEISCEVLLPSSESPVKRSHHTVCRHRARLDGSPSFLLFGGYSKLTGGLMNDLWSFDPEGRSWRRLRATGDAPTPRRDHCACVINSSEMVVFGGFDGTRNVNDCYTLNLQTLRWSRVRFEGDLPRPRRQHTMVQVDRDNLVVCGGFDGSVVLEDIHVLNFASLRSRPAGALFEGGRCLHTCASLGGSLLLFGGVTNEGRAENDLLLLEHLGTTGTSFLSGKARDLKTRVAELEMRLEEEAAHKEEIRIHHARYDRGGRWGAELNACSLCPFSSHRKSGTDLSLYECREKTRNNFLEGSLKASIQQQKEAAVHFRVVKDKLHRQRREEQALRQQNREARRQLDEKRKELAASRKAAASAERTLRRHLDDKSAEARRLESQVSEVERRFASHQAAGREQAASLRRVSQALEVSSGQAEALRREKEAAELEAADAKSHAAHLEDTAHGLERRVQEEMARAAELEGRLGDALAGLGRAEADAEGLRAAERSRLDADRLRAPEEAACQASPPTSCAEAQTLTYAELRAGVESLVLEDQERRRKAGERAERDVGGEIDRLVSEMYDLGVKNASLEDKLEYSEARNGKLLESVSVLEDENRRLGAALRAREEAGREQADFVRGLQEAAEAEIEKLKGEVSRLRGERYRRQLDQVASPGRINT